MKADGSLEEMRQRYIEDVISGEDPDAVVPEVFPDARTIRVAVTGDRPPMDYVSAGGEPLGFNTALIAEIAKRLGINIEFITVDCGARGIALATGVCDIVFWMEIGDFENWEGADEQALDFAFNMSLSSINVMRHFAAMHGYGHLSDASVKMLAHNAFMLDRFISISGNPPKLRKNDTAFKELLFYGVRDAA